jgi:hypothetical protein
MKFSYHRDCIGKPERRINEQGRPELWISDKKINLGYGWKTADLEFEEIYELISAGGHAIAPALVGDHRTEENFISHEIALVDIDSGMTLKQLQEHPFYQLYGSGYYTTPSHKDDDPRFRIIYRLPVPITDPEAMRIIYQGLLALHGAADISCKDSARLFYGTVDAEHRELTDRMVTEEGIEIICLAYDLAMEERQKAVSAAVKNDNRTYDPVSIDDVAELLDELRKHYTDLSYSLRRDVTWAILSVVNKTDAVQLMRARWSDSDKNGKYEMIVDAYKRAQLHLGTIVVMIRKHDPMFRKSNAIGNETIRQAKKMLEKMNDTNN